MEHSARSSNRPTRLGAIRPCVIETGNHTLPDDVAFQLRHCRNDRKHRLAHWGAGIQRLLMAHEVNPEASELRQSEHEPFHAPREPVESPHEDDIELTPPRVLYEFSEAGPVILCSACPIRIHAPNVPPA